MKLRDYEQMEVNKVYHFDNMEIAKDKDGGLYSHYPQFEEFWYPFSTNDMWFEKWKDRELIEGHFSY